MHNNGYLLYIATDVCVAHMNVSFIHVCVRACVCVCFIHVCVRVRVWVCVCAGVHVPVWLWVRACVHKHSYMWHHINTVNSWSFIDTLNSITYQYYSLHYFHHHAVWTSAKYERQVAVTFAYILHFIFCSTYIILLCISINIHV